MHLQRYYKFNELLVVQRITAKQSQAQTKIKVQRIIYQSTIYYPFKSLCLHNGYQRVK